MTELGSNGSIIYFPFAVFRGVIFVTVVRAAKPALTNFSFASLAEIKN